MTGLVTCPTHAVIIPHLDDFHRLEKCLSALPVDGLEIVVVDNGSSRNLAPLEAKFPKVVFTTENNRGAGLARNLGVARSCAPMLVFLDADCVPDADWWKIVQEIGYTDAVVGGAIGVFHETRGPLTGAQVIEAAFAFNQRRYVAKKGYAATANLLTSRTTFDRVGPFLSGIPEDVEWCGRAVNAGVSLEYSSHFKVGHPSRSDWLALTTKWRRLTNEMFCMVRTKKAARLIWGLRGFAVFGSFVIPSAKLLLDKRFTAPERFAGVVTLVRLRTLRCYWMIVQAVSDRSV